jgi:hypothetical protein
MQKTENPEF